MGRGLGNHANRGKALEQAVDQANAAYTGNKIAMVWRQAEPRKILYKAGKVVDAFHVGKAPVDYAGAWQGRPIAFDCKMSRERSFPFARMVPLHQVGFLAHLEEIGGGIGFLLIWYELNQAVYLLPFKLLVEYFNAWGAGGRASIPPEELRQLPKVKAGRGCTLDYLAALEEWLQQNGGEPCVHTG